MEHKCEFPDCTKMATDSSRFFKKFHCREHSHHLVVWPREFEYIFPETPAAPKRSKSEKFGFNFFKKKPQ